MLGTPCFFNILIVVLRTLWLVSLFPVLSKPPAFVISLIKLLMAMIPTGTVVYHTTRSGVKFLTGVRYSGPLCLHVGGLFDSAISKSRTGHLGPPVAYACCGTLLSFLLSPAGFCYPFHPLYVVGLTTEFILNHLHFLNPHLMVFLSSSCTKVLAESVE